MIYLIMRIIYSINDHVLLDYINFYCFPSLISLRLNSQSNSADELEENTSGSPNNHHVPNFVSIFAHDHHNQQHNHHQSQSLSGQPASTSPPSRNKDLFKNQLRFPVIGNFSATDGEVASDVINGIEILGYHNVGTIYMKGYIPAKKHVSQAVINQSPASLPNQPQIHSGGTLSQEVSTRTFSPFIPAKSGGFTAELNRINGNTLGQEGEDEDYLVIFRTFRQIISINFTCLTECKYWYFFQAGRRSTGGSVWNYSSQ